MAARRAVDLDSFVRKPEDSKGDLSQKIQVRKVNGEKLSIVLCDRSTNKRAKIVREVGQVVSHVIVKI